MLPLKLSRRLSPLDASAWLPGVWPHGVWPDDFGDAFPKGGPFPNPEKQPPRRPEPGMLRSWAGLQSEQEVPALGGPRAASWRREGPAPVAGWLCQTPRAGRLHTCPGVTSARAPGAYVSGCSERRGAGFCATLRLGPATPLGGGAWGR